MATAKKPGPPKEPVEPKVTAKRPTAPKAVAKPEAPARLHRVVAGDTLSSIAREHGTTVAELRFLNRLEGNDIVVGRKLLLARSATAPKVSDDEDDADLRALPAPPDGELPVPPADRDDDDADDDEADDDGPTKPKKVHASASGGARLVGAVQLPADKAYYLRHPKRAWGAPHVVGSTREAIAAVKRKHPSVHRLAIGDISAQRGGRLSGHRSHQTGRDVDLGLYFQRVPKSYPKRFVAAHLAPLDLAATWSLIEAFWRQSKRPGGPVAIFLDYEVQGRIYQWAKKHGVSRRTLQEVFQYAHGRWARKGLVRHEPAHDDHLHVRFGCPPRDRSCR